MIRRHRRRHPFHHEPIFSTSSSAPPRPNRTPYPFSPSRYLSSTHPIQIHQKASQTPRLLSMPPGSTEIGLDSSSPATDSVHNLFKSIVLAFSECCSDPNAANSELQVCRIIEEGRKARDQSPSRGREERGLERA